MPEETSFERRIVTVLFADLVGFTSISEQLDPEDVASIQDAYFATVRESIARHGGQLEKFIGDAAMAVFGVPKARDDDAERAIRAGLALIAGVELLGARLGLDASDLALQLRVGINSGEVAWAESGPDSGRVTGDVVNLAARLQTAADPGGVFVGELTALSAADAVELETLGELALKGKANAVPAWRVTGLRPERSREQALGALRAPMLGREPELAQLDQLRDAVTSQPRAAELLIVAPPGVGKSRLLLEFGTRTEAAGALVLRARVRADLIGPLEPVGQLLLAGLRTVDAADREAAPGALRRALDRVGTPKGRAQVVVDDVIQTLWPSAGGSDGAASDRSSERDALFAAWLEALDALAADTPSVWLVEDIHWAGGDLRAFLALAGTWPTVAGRLVVATARPSVLEHPHGTETLLQLSPLPALNAAELVTALVGEALPPDTVAAVAERSDGNPLFIEELLRSWISAGTLIPADAGGWQLAVAPEAVPMPATVQAIYAAQLDDLPPSARLVARRASVAGRRFPIGALPPLDVPEAEPGLGHLVQRAFVRGPEQDSISGDVYAYRHALLRDAGYASLSRAERTRLHLALAIWLEQTSGTDAGRVAEPIASHYEAALASLPAVGADADRRATLTETCMHWLERAADAALSLAAHEAASGLLTRALALAPPDGMEAARVRLRRGELLAASGDMETGIADLQTALEAYRSAFRSAPDPVARAGYGNAVAALSDAWIEQIRFIQARDLVAGALAEISPPDDVLVGRLLALHAWAKVAQGDRDGTLEEVERGFSLVQGAGDPRLEVEVRGWRASVRSENYVFDAAEWRELAQLAAEHGQWAVALRARSMLAADIELDGRARAALAMAAETVDLALAHGMTEKVVWARYSLATTQLLLGDWDEAVATGLAAIDSAERNAYVRPAFRTWMALVPILGARGDRALLERYSAWWQVNSGAFPTPTSAFGQVHHAATDLFLAAAGLPAVSDVVVSPEVLASEAYAQADFESAIEAIIHEWLSVGSVDPVREALRVLRATWEEPDDGTPMGPFTHASLNLMEAWLALATSDGVEAVARARRALDEARTADAPWWVARAIRAVPEADVTSAEVAEATEIERRLKVRDGASAPPA